jgi:NADPH-dependent ferric siderophore reductase
MPRVPKWLGDAVDVVFSNFLHPVTVVETEYIHPELRRISFAGNFRSIDFKPAQAVAFRVTDTHYRNYTPMSFDQESGRCSVYFYLHGNGPGSHFARRLQPGDQVKMLEPRGKALYRVGSKYHFFFGDETALGLFNSLTQAVHANSQEYFGVLELREACATLPDKTGIMLDVVPRSDIPAEHAITYINTLHERVWHVWQTATFYLVGNANAIKAFRKALLLKGVAAGNIQAQAYWAEGREGL